MSTSVKIRDKDKERLDRIKARLTLRGIKLNQEQLLGKIISIAEASPLLFDELEFKSVSDERKHEILAKSYTLGSTGEETIDDNLYGDE